MCARENSQRLMLSDITSPLTLETAPILVPSAPRSSRSIRNWGSTTGLIRSWPLSVRLAVSIAWMRKIWGNTSGASQLMTSSFWLNKLLENSLNGNKKTSFGNTVRYWINIFFCKHGVWLSNESLSSALNKAWLCNAGFPVYTTIRSFKRSFKKYKIRGKRNKMSHTIMFFMTGGGRWKLCIDISYRLKSSQMASWNNRFECNILLPLWFRPIKYKTVKVLIRQKRKSTRNNRG